MEGSRRERMIELAARIAELRAELGAAEAELAALMQDRQRRPSGQTGAVSSLERDKKKP